jgi:PAS domain S-box-containing protein
VRLATESGGIGIWHRDFVAGRNIWNDQMYRLFGLAPGGDAETLQLWQAHLHPEDRAAVAQALRDAIDDLAPYDLEYRIVWDDGSVRHVRGAGWITRDADGRPTRMVGVCWDVTDSRRLAAELTLQVERQREASERETALFRSSPDVLTVLRVDPDGDRPGFRYEAVSPAVVPMTGWAPEELIGQPPEACLPPEAARLLLAEYRRCVASRSTTAFVLALATPKGQRELEGSLAPIRHPVTGHVVRLVGAMRDVTERRRLEAAELHGQKMEAIGRLAAGVAHDFNNILQSISSSLEMVQDELSPGTLAHDLTAIGLRSANRGSYLTHHLLSYARKQMLRPEVVELPALLSDLHKLLQRTLGPTIAVTMRIDPAARTLKVDPGQIQTALLNLAINASHAMPEGGALLIETRAMVQDGAPWVTLAVTDTGTGMDAATLARATEPFFTTKGLNGSGLGLSMVQGFAEQSGGRMAITSSPGRGTTVALQLPAALGAVPEPAAPACEPSRPPQGATVLLVDDDADVLVTTGAFLEKAGFTILRATSADQALGLLADGGRMDAVITDYAMPGMNGADLIAELRATRPGLPGIIISGFADLMHMDTGEDGRLVTLHKPFQREQLIRNLRRVLGWDGAVAVHPPLVA